jgi:hypothetical protein
VKQFRVLIVDDEPRIITFLNLKLKVSGYEVLTASNGAQAVAQVRAQEPDLLRGPKTNQDVFRRADHHPQRQRDKRR